MKLILLVLVALIFISTQAFAQTFDCTNGFTDSGACGAGIFQGGKTFQLAGTQNGSSPALTGSRVLLLSQGAQHAALSFNYQTQVDASAFTSTFRFVPNGWNIVWFIENSTNNPWGFNGKIFSAGAGCEADFYQGFSQPNPPDKVVALELDGFEPVNKGGSFSNSTAQLYTSPPGGYVDSPCSPPINGEKYYDKISTAPVSLNSPANAAFTTTGHTYNATVVYDGNEVTLDLYDETAGDRCPGSNCFSHSWSTDAAGRGVDIVGSVGNKMAWVGLGGATNMASNYPLYVSGFSYAQGASPPQPTPTKTSTPTMTPTSTPTATSTSTPGPSGNCSFTGPSGTSRWQCQ